MIEHKVSLAEFEAIENPVLRQVTLMKRLRELGMPIIGAIVIERVERGSLTIGYDDLFNEITYTYQP